MGFLLVLNPSAGSNSGTELARRVASRLSDVREITLGRDQDAEAAIDDAVAEGRVVIAGGGDGTVNQVAQRVVGRGVLGVLPVGTLNHFARDLGVGDVDTALRVLSEGSVREIDVGRARGRVFVNNMGIGLYPETVETRERHEDRLGRWVAAAGAAVSVWRRSRPLVGSITADGDARALLAWMVFVGNNRFSTTPGQVGRRERLDRGVLDLRLLTVGTRRARRTELAWRVLRGREWRSRLLVRREARRIDIDLEGGPRAVSWDGESGEPAAALSVEVLPRALRVVAPGRG